MYAKDLSEPKYQFSIRKREGAGIKSLDDQSAFIEYSNIMDGVYNDIGDYNPKRKIKILIGTNRDDCPTNAAFKVTVTNCIFQ